MAVVVDVKQQVGKASGKPYWNVKLEDNTYANSFSPVTVGQEGTVTETTKGGKTFRNFNPIAQASEQPAELVIEATGNPHIASQLDRIEKMLKFLVLNHPKYNKMEEQLNLEEQDDSPI